MCATRSVLLVLSFGCAGMFLSACGGSVAPGAPALLEAGTPDSRQAVMETGNADSPVCPSSKPSSGDSCTGVLACEYGDDPHVSCDTLITCTAGAWMTTQQPAASGCSTTNPQGCPSTLDALMSSEGCTPNLSCYYPGARCVCGTLVPGAPVDWLCDTGTNTTMDASAGASCPLPRPRIGTACTEAGVTCEYGWCQSEDDALACTNGAWVLTPASTNGCPL
jgi:hypothetical protein